MVVVSCKQELCWCIHPDEPMYVPARAFLSDAAGTTGMRVGCSGDTDAARTAWVSYPSV